MDRGAWWATAHGVAKSRTQPRDQHFHFQGAKPRVKLCGGPGPQHPFLAPSSFPPAVPNSSRSPWAAGCRQPLHWAHSCHLFTAGPLHRNPQVSNFQRCKCASHQCQAWVTPQLALRLLLLMTLQLYHLPPPLPPPSVILVCSLDASPCMPAVVPCYCTFQGTAL